MLILKEGLPADAGRTGSRIDTYSSNWLSGQPVILGDFRAVGQHGSRIASHVTMRMLLCVGEA